MSAGKALVESLKHYLPGDEVERAAVAERLVGALLEEKALAYIRTKFQRQGYKHLEGLMAELRDFPNQVAEAKVADVKPKRGRPKKNAQEVKEEMAVGEEKAED